VLLSRLSSHAERQQNDAWLRGELAANTTSRADKGDKAGASIKPWRPRA
jgi:hypothetical protein